MKHILYTTREGGEFRYTQGENDEVTVELFNKWKKEGHIAFKTGDANPVSEKLAYIMLIEDIDNWDFVINRKR